MKRLFFILTLSLFASTTPLTAMEGSEGAKLRESGERNIARRNSSKAFGGDSGDKLKETKRIIAKQYQSQSLKEKTNTAKESQIKRDSQEFNSSFHMAVTSNGTISKLRESMREFSLKFFMSNLDKTCEEQNKKIVDELNTLTAPLNLTGTEKSIEGTDEQNKAISKLRLLGLNEEKKNIQEKRKKLEERKKALEEKIKK